SRKPVRELANLLLNVPKARVFDEMMKLLLSGHAADGVRRLRKEGLHHGVLPLLDVILEQPLGERFVMLALENTDERINAGKTVSPGFLFASLLWHEVLAAWNAAQARGMHTMPARFLNRSGRRPYLLLEHPRFRAGFDFLQLRCKSREIESEAGDWWEKFQRADEPARA